MAKGWLKNLFKGLMNNGFYMDSNGKWSAYNNFSKTGLPTEDVVGDDAASFPGLDSAIDNVADKYLGTGLTDSEKEANRFSASQAERARTFEAKQAQIARDWNEEMYEKYNSLSGKIAQAEKAGVNPLLAVTGNAVSPMGTVGGSASSPSPGSVSPSGHGLTDLIGTLMGVLKLKSEINLMDSEAQRNLADANKSDKETSWIDRLNTMSLKESEQNISESVYRILNISADTEVKTAELGEIAAGIANTNADTKVKQQQIAVLLSQISLNSKSVEQMEANISLMLSEIGVNRAEATKLAQEVRNLRQEYTSGRMLAEARKMATPDGTESAFDKLCLKLLALLKN